MVLIVTLDQGKYMVGLPEKCPPTNLQPIVTYGVLAWRGGISAV